MRVFKPGDGVEMKNAGCSKVTPPTTQQNDVTHQLMQKIWKELKKTRSHQNNKHKKHKFVEKPRYQKIFPRKPNHGKGCKCSKCLKWRSYLKGKIIPGKGSKFCLPQYDGNNSDVDNETELQRCNVARGSNEMAHQEGQSTSYQSQPPFVEIPATCEGSQSKSTSHNRGSKQSDKRSSNLRHFATNHRYHKRPANLAAKSMLKKFYAFLEEAKQSCEESSGPEGNNSSDYKLETEEESTSASDDDIFEEEFYSANSPLNNERRSTPLQRAKKSKQRIETPNQEDFFGNFSSSESESPDVDDHRQPPTNPNATPPTNLEDPDEDSLVHVESFEVDINSQRVDQLNIPATSNQAPEQYLRFLSKLKLHFY